MALAPQIEILIIASLVAVTCVIPGVFLVLRKMSLMSDAISHSVLLGIVVAFFVVESLHSPLLIMGAAMAGILTVTLTELIIKTRRVKEDAAIGLVFPVLFALAVILITKFAENVHLDTDAVLLGEIAFAPFNRITWNGMDLGPEALWVMGAVFLVNALFVALFYKELKLATFDTALAASLGFSPAVIHYGLMTLVSITAVGAFDVVGSILVVAFIIAPPAAAYLLTHRLSTMMFLSAGIGIASSLAGYGMARALDVSIAGSMATMTGVFFLLSLFFAPKRGLISKMMLHNTQKLKFASHMLIVHLLDHEGTPEETKENRKSTVHHHLKWTHPFTEKIVRRSSRKGWVTHEKDRLFLTPLGRETARQVMVMG